ncbi:hypothetical protein ACFQS7_12830 [Dankookia sp. GCM10030260]|uniref:hypothetical protein n=1 Tax=Dankookia sp. GCM10030260 TaxID=3273390 RepID=UPI00361E3F93
MDRTTGLDRTLAGVASFHPVPGAAAGPARRPRRAAGSGAMRRENPVSDLPAPIIAPLVRDLVAWVAAEPRPYREVMEAWRTSCPRLTVWEDAVDGGFVALGPGGPEGLQVSATPRGRALLAARG